MFYFIDVLIYFYARSSIIYLLPALYNLKSWWGSPRLLLTLPQKNCGDHFRNLVFQIHFKDIGVFKEIFIWIWFREDGYFMIFSHLEAWHIFKLLKCRHTCFIALSRFCVFYKLKICGNPASRKSISAIFPTAHTHFMSPFHVLLILSDTLDNDLSCNQWHLKLDIISHSRHNRSAQ